VRNSVGAGRLVAKPRFGPNADRHGLSLGHVTRHDAKAVIEPLDCNLWARIRLS
jgi:hypothetical protein